MKWSRNSYNSFCVIHPEYWKKATYRESQYRKCNQNTPFSRCNRTDLLYARSFNNFFLLLNSSQPVSFIFQILDGLALYLSNIDLSFARSACTFNRLNDVALLKLAASGLLIDNIRFYFMEFVNHSSPSNSLTFHYSGQFCSLPKTAHWYANFFTSVGSSSDGIFGLFNKGSAFFLRSRVEILWLIFCSFFSSLIFLEQQPPGNSKLE